MRNAYDKVSSRTVCPCRYSPLFSEEPDEMEAWACVKLLIGSVRRLLSIVHVAWNYHDLRQLLYSYPAPDRGGFSDYLLDWRDLGTT